MTPLEQLREMRKKELTRWGILRTEPPKDDVTLLVLDALEAVLAMPKRTKCAPDDEETALTNWGANQFRSEVHSLIASALGGGGASNYNYA